MRRNVLRGLLLVATLLASLGLQAAPLRISISIPGPGAASYYPVELIPKIGADQAENWGLIWRCLDDDKLMAEAEKLAQHFSTAPTKGLARTKQAIYASGGNTLEQQLDLERNYQRELGFGPDYREGVAAFMEKRPAKFTGK